MKNLQNSKFLYDTIAHDVRFRREINPADNLNEFRSAGDYSISRITYTI